MPGAATKEVVKKVFDVPKDQKEAQCLTEFKALTHDLPIPEETDDYFYLKWLRARDCNLFNARTMLESYLQWKKTRKPSLIVWTPPQLITDETVVKITGNDNDGRPVVCVLGGQVDFQLIVDSGLKVEFTQFILQILERLSNAEAESRKRNGGIVHTVLVVDLEGMTLRKVMHYEVIQLASTFAKVLEAYYPELLHRFFFINAPWAFSLLYNVTKPFLSAVTLSKIQLFTNDSNKWRPALLEHIPAKSLPQEFGGAGESIFDQKQ